MVDQNENTKSTDEVNFINFLNSINSSETTKKKKTSPDSLSRLKIAIWNCLKRKYMYCDAYVV